MIPNNNIIQFKKPRASVVSQENCIDESANGLKYSLQAANNFAFQIIDDIPGNELDGLKFSISVDSMIALQDAIIDEEDSVVLTYEALDTKDEKTILYSLSFGLELGNDNECESYGLSRTDSDGNIERLNYDTGKWETNERLKKLYSSYSHDREKAKFIDALCFCTDTEVQFMDEDIVIPLLNSFNELIKLGRKASRITDYEFLPISPEITKAYLIPHDPLRCGVAVGLEGNEYVLYQYIDADAFASAIETETHGIPVEMDEEAENSVFLKEIARTRDIKEITKSFWLMLDHYSGEDVIFCFPLSLTAYVESTKPFRGFVIKNKYGRVYQDKLSGQEKENYKNLKKMFARETLKELEI